LHRAVEDERREVRSKRLVYGRFEERFGEKGIE